MKLEDRPHRAIWHDPAEGCVRIIDQTLLPHRLEIAALDHLDEFVDAITQMRVRGAPLIGATAAWGLAFALRRDSSTAAEARAAERLLATRPTAVNLAWALHRVRAAARGAEADLRAKRAIQEAETICQEDAAVCEAIGEAGLPLLEQAWRAKGPGAERLEILTHCNAGWLATVDWGTALAPIYKAHEAGLPVHVWVDETRPRNQGAHLTAWELGQCGVPHTLVTDNAGGHLMQHGRVDLCIVGSDRTTARGDVCNKIGTYLKALAAHDNAVPFYVALPVSTIDWSMEDGVEGVPIEERDAAEVLEVWGLTAAGARTAVRIAPDATPAANFAFDVTPARLVSGLVTEYGVVAANASALRELRRRSESSPEA